MGSYLQVCKLKDVQIIGNYLSKIGKKGGSVKSAAKKKSSKENGKKGGRPVIKK